MTTYSAPIDTGLTSSEAFQKAVSQLLVEGVATIATPTALQVIQRGAGANMSVDISIGSALISNSSGTFGISAWIDATANQTIATASGANPRIDAVVAWIDTSVISTITNNNPGSLKFADVQGTVGSSPVAPTDSAVQSSLGAGIAWVRLANVTVPQSATQIVTANIADQRPPFAVRARLWGGSSNTYGHTVPNVADDTVMLLNASQTFTNKIISGTTNDVRAGGANSSLVDSNSIQIDLEQQATDRSANYSNYIASGCTWTPDSAGSTLNGSMSSGVVYIGGRRLTVGAVTAHAFTASRDTYVDFQDAGNGTATVIYTAVTNNSNSPALGSSGTVLNTIRNGIIVSGASNIAAQASINQGQVQSTLPTTNSSVPVAVCDTTGNLIYPKANQKLIGIRIYPSGSGPSVTSGTYAQFSTGLTVPVLATAFLTGRSIAATCGARAFNTSAGIADVSLIVNNTSGAVLTDTSVQTSVLTFPTMRGYYSSTSDFSIILAGLSTSSGAVNLQAFNNSLFVAVEQM